MPIYFIRNLYIFMNSNNKDSRPRLRKEMSSIYYYCTTSISATNKRLMKNFIIFSAMSRKKSNNIL